MPWARIDDRLFCHPKVDRLLEHGDDGLGALGLWVLALSRVVGQMSDGWISEHALARLAPESGDRVELLVAVGLLDRSQDGYLFHDFTEWNPSKDQLLEQRKQKRERQQRWRSNASRHASTDASRNGSSDALVTLAPSHPIPIKRSQGDASRDASTRILPEWPTELAQTALKWARFDAPNADDDELRRRCEQRFGHMLPNAQDPSE